MHPFVYLSPVEGLLCNERVRQGGAADDEANLCPEAAYTSLKEVGNKFLFNTQ